MMKHGLQKISLYILFFAIVFPGRTLLDNLLSNSVSRFNARGISAEDNPGILMEAFAEIKTGRNNATYSSGYLAEEFFKANRLRSNRKINGVLLPWIERGPGNVSGRSRVIAVDPTDATGNTWFIGTVGGGVWKTTDGGASWENKTPSLGTLSVATMAIAASNPDIIYVGTGMGYGRIVDLTGSGIWKSTDHGESWIQLESTANGELLDAINRIVVDPDNPDLVIACSNGYTSHLGPNSTVNGEFGKDRKSGIFRSEDGGLSWTLVFDPEVLGTDTDNRVQQIIPDPTDFNILYASINEVGVIKSQDKGLTWVILPTNFFSNTSIGVPQENGFGLPGISGRAELAIAPTDPERIYASVERPLGEVADLFMSKNGGDSWVEVADSGNDPNWFEESGGVTRNAGWFDNTIIVNPFNKNELFVGGVNLYKVLINETANTRTTTPSSWWIQNNQGIPTLHADHHFSVAIPTDINTGQYRLLVANDGGLGVSEDGGATWIQIGGAGASGVIPIAAGLNTTQFYAVDKKPGEKIYIGGMQDNNSYISPPDPDATSEWIRKTGGDGIEAIWHFDKPTHVLSTSQFGILHRSTDGGNTFSRLPEPRPGFTPFLTKIGTSKSDPDLIFVIGTQGVKRSSDFGDTWSLTTIQGNWLGYRPFDNIEVSLANPQVVWITSRLDADPASGVPGGIHVSADGGITFHEISQNFPAEVRESSGLATHPSDPNTAYFLFSAPDAPKILKTADLGQTFEDISGFGLTGGRTNSIGFPDVAVFSLLVMPYNDQIIWAGTEIGLFISENGGASWTIADNGLPNAGIFQMSIVDGEILVATQGRGIWTVTLPELASYSPPAVTKTPGLKNLFMQPNGQYTFVANLRSAYDSTHVFINGEKKVKIAANAAASDETLFFTPDREEVLAIQLKSFKSTAEYLSPVQELLVYPASSVETFIARFDSQAESSNFITTGMTIGPEEGFSSPTLHTDHPYKNLAQYVSQLKIPIKVASSEAIVQFRDVVLVEPGIVDDYTQPDFYDYVIVEGTRDGINWLPLLDGYDSRKNSAWLETYNDGLTGQNSTGTGDESLFVKHEINLLDFFAAGDEIFIRFRLESDPAANGWGWAIDNLIIQNALVSELTELRQSNPVLTVFPNPVTNNATLRYLIPEAGPVSFRIIDLGGKVIESTLYTEQQAGLHEKLISVNHLEKGFYLFMIEFQGKISWYRVFKN